MRSATTARAAFAASAPSASEVIATAESTASGRASDRAAANESAASRCTSNYTAASEAADWSASDKARAATPYEGTEARAIAWTADKACASESAEPRPGAPIKNARSEKKIKLGRVVAIRKAAHW